MADPARSGPHTAPTSALKRGPKRRRRSVVLGIPAAIVAILAALALWRVGAPGGGEDGAAGTMGVNADRHAALHGVEVRQLTSDRTFWAGERDEEPVFVVSNQRVRLEPGTDVDIVGVLVPAPDVATARREWGVDEATARAVRERGVYLRTTEIRSSR
jgi:hypothetical protein